MFVARKEGKSLFVDGSKSILESRISSGLSYNIYGIKMTQSLIMKTCFFFPSVWKQKWKIIKYRHGKKMLDCTLDIYTGTVRMCVCVCARDHTHITQVLMQCHSHSHRNIPLRSWPHTDNGLLSAPSSLVLLCVSWLPGRPGQGNSGLSSPVHKPKGCNQTLCSIMCWGFDKDRRDGGEREEGRHTI